MILGQATEKPKYYPVAQTFGPSQWPWTPRPKALTPQAITTADLITRPRLSFDATRVVYQVQPLYRTSDIHNSSIWIAEVSKPGSARPLTNGLFNDHSSVFHPSDNCVFFLSDRHSSGGAHQVYKLDLGDAFSNPIPVTSIENKKPVQFFAISPNGKYIAYVSEDEPTIQEIEEQKKHDYYAFYDRTHVGRLRLQELRDSARVRTLVHVNRHVESFTWSHDSAEIMYRTTCTPTLESTRFTIIQEKVSVLPPGTPSTHMANFSHIPGSDIVCTTDGLIYHVDVMSREKFFSARAIWSLDPSDGSEIEPHHFYLGESEDAFHVISLGSQGQLAVEVATGLESRIDVLDHSGRLFTLFETHNEGIYNDGMYEEKGWDARLLPNGRYTLVAFRSSAITGEQTELWSGTTETRRAVSLTAKLSSHNEWVNNFTLANSEEFLWKASDGFELQGIMAYPAGMPLTKLPTVLVAHGGPQNRDTWALELNFIGWRPFLASRGYLVLSPNYRGGIGRGDEFAKAANGDTGRFFWGDAISMVEEAVRRGIADPDKLAIAGYSKGGHIAAWGCTRPDSPFKAGVVGGGITDCGSMALQSDLPEFNAALVGGAPWRPGPHILQEASPVRYVRNVRVPMLLLHGEGDKRVPLPQAVGFMRGLVREGRNQDRSRLVVFPREDHKFQEQAHAEDLLTMLAEHLDGVLMPTTAEASSPCDADL